MRRAIDPQMRMGAVDISIIQFDLRSRDEIPKLLMGLQYIYCNLEVREEVFNILKEIIPVDTDHDNGRPGMELWKILVLGTIRLNCNWDYDKLQEIANNHMTLRQMLGHGIMDRKYTYALQTLRDNISLFTPEILDRINQVVIKCGHKVLGKKKEQNLRGRCDSFVVETDVHYPTDINLLFDAISKLITLVASLCSSLGMSLWRQSRHNIRTAKKLFRKAQKLKRSTSKDARKKAEKEAIIVEAHKVYIELVHLFVIKVKDTIKILRDRGLAEEEKILEIEKYIIHAERQIDQINRRVIQSGKIPHDEKVFSIFEEHTEWISKGKAGIPQELGLKVCILEDQYGFILHHQVMQHQTDDQVAVTMVEGAKKGFSGLSSCSFDKGFYTPANREQLAKLLNLVVLSSKGRPSLVEQEISGTETYIKAKRKHSAVESAINALENHGLDRCHDHGIEGFKRYVALAVVARNIEKLGNIVKSNTINKQKRLEGIRKSKLIAASS